jgi:REP element-mobilizing transposase RayT
MRASGARPYGRSVPRRPPINPEGWYHIGSRGCYGRTLFGTVGEHECFLRMYGRVALKYRWHTVAWALMKNHHHFVLRLTEGGLSEGLRELHGGYARWIHALYGQTREGHLFRHAFFARLIADDADLFGACAYVDANPSAHRIRPVPRPADWCGYAATLGSSHARSFHTPSALLELLDSSPLAARRKYRQIVVDEHARRRQGSSPNDVIERD